MQIEYEPNDEWSPNQSKSNEELNDDKDNQENQIENGSNFTSISDSGIVDSIPGSGSRSSSDGGGGGGEGDGGKMSRNNKYKQKLCDSWLKMFSPWLTRCHDDANKPYCKACQTRLDCNRCHLRRHERTTKHKRNVAHMLRGGETVKPVLAIRQERSKYYHPLKHTSVVSSMEEEEEEEEAEEEENTSFNTSFNTSDERPEMLTVLEEEPELEEEDEEETLDALETEEILLDTNDHDESSMVAIQRLEEESVNVLEQETIVHEDDNDDGYDMVIEEEEEEDNNMSLLNSEYSLESEQDHNSNIIYEKSENSELVQQLPISSNEMMMDNGMSLAYILEDNAAEDASIIVINAEDEEEYDKMGEGEEEKHHHSNILTPTKTLHHQQVSPNRRRRILESQNIGIINSSNNVNSNSYSNVNVEEEMTTMTMRTSTSTTTSTYNKGGRAPLYQQQHQQEKNHVDLFFESVSSTVKALTPKLIAETKMRVSQLICELELRALRERGGGDPLNDDDDDNEAPSPPPPPPPASQQMTNVIQAHNRI